MTSRVTCGMSLSGPIFASCTAARNRSVGAIEPRIGKEVLALLSAENSVKSRDSYGGTAPKNVRREANRWLKALAKEQR